MFRQNVSNHLQLQEPHFKFQIIARHNFYLGLPDQTASISQADVEQELQEMEQHYEKYKHIYRWTERALFV